MWMIMKKKKAEGISYLGSHTLELCENLTFVSLSFFGVKERQYTYFTDGQDELMKMEVILKYTVNNGSHSFLGFSYPPLEHKPVS